MKQPASFLIVLQLFAGVLVSCTRQERPNATESESVPSANEANIRFQACMSSKGGIAVVALDSIEGELRHSGLLELFNEEQVVGLLDSLAQGRVTLRTDINSPGLLGYYLDCLNADSPIDDYYQREVYETLLNEAEKVIATNNISVDALRNLAQRSRRSAWQFQAQRTFFLYCIWLLSADQA